MRNASGTRGVVVLKLFLTLSLPESITGTCKEVLTFESVDEILWCDHSNEISLAILSHGTICFAEFEKKRDLGFFLIVTLVTARSERVNKGEMLRL